MGKEQELFEAARNGQADIVEKILSFRLKKVNSLASLRKLPGPNTQDSSGYTSLHFAALNGHKDVVRSLLQHDANVNLTDKKGCTPLHLASWAGNYDIVNYILMQSNIEPNLNLVNSDNESPLHSASQFNHHSVVSLLLMHGADIKLRNSKDETAFDLACEYGRYETVKVFLDFEPTLIYTSNRISHSPLHLACKNGHLSVAKLLLNSNFNVNTLTENGSALHESVFYGRLDLVRLLLEYKIDTSLVNQQGKNVFDLLTQLNTSVSRTIENIIENHQHRHSQQNMLNKSTSVHCILPPDQYKDKNQKSELTTYIFSETSDTYQRNYSFECLINNSFSHKYAQNSLSNYPDNMNQINSTSESNERKVLPLDCDSSRSDSERKLKNMNNFSRSQDSILDSYLSIKSDNNQAKSDQSQQCKKKNKTQLSTFVQQQSSIYASTKRLESQPRISDDIYSSLDESICSYSLQSNHNDYCEPNSLQNDYLEQNYNEHIKSCTSFDYEHHTFANNLYSKTNERHNHKQFISPPLSLQQQLSHLTTKSMNYLNSIQKMSCKSNFSHVEKINDNKYDICTYPVTESDQNLSNNKQQTTIFDHHLITSHSLLNQSENCLNHKRHQNDKNQLIKHATITKGVHYLDHNLKINLNTTKEENKSILKNCSNFVDKGNTNSLLTNNNNSMIETVQRIKVNSNDLYAQIDKSRKNSPRKVPTNQNEHSQVTTLKIQDLLNFYDQPSKIIKKVPNQSSLTKEQIEKKIEKNSFENKPLFSAHSFDQSSIQGNNNKCNNNRHNNNNDSEVIDQIKFAKAKLINREKRATIAITLNENEMDELKFEGRSPPSAQIAINQISKILKPIYENYEKTKSKPIKQTQTDEKQFNRFLRGKKMIIIQKEIQFKNECLIDKSTCTEEIDECVKKIKKINGDQIKESIKDKKIDKDEKHNENTGSTIGDLINMDELKRLENSFNEIKSNKFNKSDTINDINQTKKVSTLETNSILRPRRQAPAPPIPKHNKTIKLSQINDGNKKEINFSSTNSSIEKKENSMNDKILSKVDKDLSSKERDLLTKTLNLPLNLDWKHDPLTLYKQTCHYLAFFLGSNKVKNIQGVASSQECIRDYRKMLKDNKLSSLTAVIISINYKCVRCVDVNCQKIIIEHEIRNVHFACQDMDHFRFFAYVTKDDNDRNYMNCHVFSACNLEMTSEILITLAQSFQIAFRITNGQTIDQLRKHYVKSKLNNKIASQNKTNKLPSPPPRHSSNCLLNDNNNLTKSLSESQFNQLLISASNGFQINNHKSTKNRNKLLSCENQSNFRAKQIMSASNSIKSIKSVKSESNFISNRRKSFQSITKSHFSQQMNSLDNLDNLIKPTKPVKPKSLLKQLSLSEENSKYNNCDNKPHIPEKPKAIPKIVKNIL